MDIHALTITWNGANHLKKLKPSLDRAIAVTNVDNFYWHVRDNGSKDETEQLFEEWKSDKVKFYKIGHNRDNYAKCHNFLYEKTIECGIKDSDLILFINNDIEIIDHNSINKMIKLFNDDVGIVGCKLLYPSGKLQHAGVIFGEQYGYYPFHYRRGEVDNELSSINRKFQAVTFAFALMRAECYKNLPKSQINEDLHWCFEDCDTCLQVNKIQKKDIVYCGNTNIIHHESESLKKNPINKLYQKHNFALFKQMWFGKYDIDHNKYVTAKQYNKV